MTNTTTSTPKNPIQIEEVLLHVGAHTDEYEAYRRMRAYGEKFFPGAQTATVRFTMGLSIRPDADWDAEKKLPLGCGNTRFDEHKTEVERLPGECCTTLVSAYLELNHDPILKKMADETLRCDTTRGVKLTELPELVKMLHRRLSNGDEFVLRWSMKTLNCIHHQLCCGYAPVNGERTLIQIFEDLAKSGHFADEDARANLKRILEESVERKDHIFELSFIVECLHRHPKIIKYEDVADWVRFPLEHLYADQVEFLRCEKLCKELKESGKGWYDITALLNGKEKKLKLFFCQTDNSMMLRAARRTGANIIILRNSKGQIQVFINSAIRGLNLSNFARMIRWLELNDKRAATWEELDKDGTHPLVQNWYFFQKAQQLMNGSLSHPNTQATEIGPSSILEVARYAFHHTNGVREWKKLHRVVSKRVSRVQRGSEKTTKSAKATTPVSPPIPEPPTTVSASINGVEEAFKNAKPRRPRSKKSPTLPKTDSADGGE